MNLWVRWVQAPGLVAEGKWNLWAPSWWFPTHFRPTSPIPMPESCPCSSLGGLRAGTGAGMQAWIGRIKGGSGLVRGHAAALMMLSWVRIQLIRITTDMSKCPVKKKLNNHKKLMHPLRKITPGRQATPKAGSHARKEGSGSPVTLGDPERHWGWRPVPTCTSVVSWQVVQGCNC